MLEAKEKRYFVVSEAAAIIGLTPGRIYQMVWAKQISAIRLGKITLIPESEVERIKNTPRPQGRPRGRPKRQY